MRAGTEIFTILMHAEQRGDAELLKAARLLQEAHRKAENTIVWRRPGSQYRALRRGEVLDVFSKGKFVCTLSGPLHDVVVQSPFPPPNPEN